MCIFPHLFLAATEYKRILGVELGYLVRSSMSTNMASCSMWSSSRISSNWTSSSFRPGESRERDAGMRLRPDHRRRAFFLILLLLCVCFCVLPSGILPSAFPDNTKVWLWPTLRRGIRWVKNKLLGLLGISGTGSCKMRGYLPPSTELADASRPLTVNTQGKLLTVKVFELTYRKVLSHPL